MGGAGTASDISSAGGDAPGIFPGVDGLISGRIAEEISAATGVATISGGTSETGMSGDACGFRTMMNPPHLRQRKRAAFDLFNSETLRRKRDRQDSHSTTMDMSEAASRRKIVSIICIRLKKGKGSDSGSDSGIRFGEGSPPSAEMIPVIISGFLSAGGVRFRANGLGIFTGRGDRDIPAIANPVHRK